MLKKIISKDKCMKLHDIAEAIIRKRVVRKGYIIIKKKSDRPGFKVIKGKEIKIPYDEVLKRKKGARIAARKRKSKKGSIARKRAMSMRKRTWK